MQRDPFQLKLKFDSLETLSALMTRHQGDASDIADALAVFDPAQLAALGQSEASVSKELQARNKRLIDELRQRGPRRALALHPDALARLDELRARLPHFGEVIDELGDQVALAREARRPLRAQPLLLLGPPGVGKSYFCNQLADALGLPTHRLAMDNAQGSALLSGSATFWSNSQTGLVFKALAQGTHCSPLILLDELDKAPRDAQYDPLASLHGLLEPSTAQHFEDSSFGLQLDARFVLWVTTANTLEGLDAPLRSRFLVHAIPAPTREQARRIAVGVAQDVVAQSGLAMEVGPGVLDALAPLTPRQQRQSLERALARAVRHQRLSIQVEDLPASRPRLGENLRRPFGFVPV